MMSFTGAAESRPNDAFFWTSGIIIAKDFTQHIINIYTEANEFWMTRSAKQCTDRYSNI